MISPDIYGEDWTIIYRVKSGWNAWRPLGPVFISRSLVELQKLPNKHDRQGTLLRPFGILWTPSSTANRTVAILKLVTSANFEQQTPHPATNKMAAIVRIVNHTHTHNGCFLRVQQNDWILGIQHLQKLLENQHHIILVHIASNEPFSDIHTGSTRIRKSENEAWNPSFSVSLSVGSKTKEVL